MRTSPLLVALALVVATACRAAPASLVDLAELAPGDGCEHGGLALNTGADDDGDGALSTAEIDDTVTICNGAPGVEGEDGEDGGDGATGNDGASGDAALMGTTALPPGDPDCPAGGLQVDYGVDNGDGGETAGDGILGVGEVDDTQYICNGEDLTNVVDPIDEPGGTPGLSSMDASGADGVAGTGGEGGIFELHGCENGSGHARVFTTGTADAGFTPPARVVNLGPVPLVISSDLAMPMFADQASATGLADGEAFLTELEDRVYLFDGGGSHARVSGLHVESGATLTVGDPLYNGAVLEFDNDLAIDGTLTTSAGSGNQRRRLNLTAAGCYLGPDSLVDVSSLPPSGQPNRIDFTCDGSNTGIFINEGGTITTRSTTPGLSGSHVDIFAYHGVFNNGPIDTKGGGSEPDDDGGAGGSVTLWTAVGPVYNDATIDLSGGDADAWAGSAADFSMGCEQQCAVRNAGTILAHGGTSQTSYGGDGGRVTLTSVSGSLVNSGDLLVHGGSTDGTDELGGTGGEITLEAGEGDYGTRALAVSGILAVQGGAGDHGGAGSGLYVRQNDSCVGALSSVSMYGFDRLDVSGGDGADGGEAGYMFFWKEESDTSVPSGGVVNYAYLDSHGGNASAGEAGAGGDIEFGCEDGWIGSTCFVGNYASADTSQGDGYGGDGSAGSFYIYGTAWTEQIGDLDLSGGDGLLSDHGGGANDADIWSLGPTTFTGNIDMTGGDAMEPGAEGGSAGRLFLEGEAVTFTGDFDGKGGDANLVDGFGGWGGEVYVKGRTPSTMNVGSGNVAAGAGFDAGTDGRVRVDGIYWTSLYLP